MQQITQEGGNEKEDTGIKEETWETNLKKLYLAALTS